MYLVGPVNPLSSTAKSVRATSNSISSSISPMYQQPNARFAYMMSNMRPIAFDRM